MMNRREFACFGGAALLGGGMSVSFAGKIGLPPARGKRIFFEDADIPQIRANARSILLGETFRDWASRSPASFAPAWKQFRKTGNITYDLRKVWIAFEETSVVHLVEPTEARRKALVDSMEEVIALPKWDYMLDGDEALGLMRSSMATSRMLFAREVLGDTIDPDFDKRLMKAIADKGVAPCYTTIYGMENPDEVVGWRMDPDHPFVQDIDMARWPIILGSNNLRGAPTMALGIGGLALLGIDDRAEKWVTAAEESAKTAFDLFFGDGSYFEGLSYSEYLLRTVLAFCEAHYRIKGTIDWASELDFKAHIDYVAAMQAGKKSDGTPDIVNFSDASKSIYPCVSSWIEKHTGNPVAQYATNHFAAPGYFLDYLWYRPDRPSRSPSRELKNYRSEQDWIISRSGWRAEDAVLAFRSGRPANHEHADRNSFFYKIYGERLLNDPFGSSYDVKSAGWTLRLTEAHNAVLIGGKGHQYHNGEEGVNESQASAKVVRWSDRGDRVTWCSDATQAYKLVDENVSSVTRTMVFAKPNVVVVFDRVILDKASRTVEARFFPDNRDELAKVEVDGTEFRINRPNASLYGKFASSVSAMAKEAELELKPGVIDPDKDPGSGNFGRFPFVGIRAGKARDHSLVTVLVARPEGNSEKPVIEIEKVDTGWAFRADDVKGLLDTSDRIPEVFF
jgi:hypothetical protein|tara:strand:- start:4222 stop:6255 length:2034 start_codon:yes stop_codon:yes gene_type:complete